MTGDGKPGNAVADKWRETFEKNRKESDLSITRLEVRADMKSIGEEEISSVIDQRAIEAQQKKLSEPPVSGYSRAVVQLIQSVRGWPQAVFGLAVLALVAFWLWLHRH